MVNREAIENNLILITDIHTKVEKLKKKGMDNQKIKNQIKRQFGSYGEDIAWLYLTENELGLRRIF